MDTDTFNLVLAVFILTFVFSVLPNLPEKKVPEEVDARRREEK